MRTRIMVVASLMVFAVGLGWYIAAQQGVSWPTIVPGQVLRVAALHAIVTRAEADTDDDRRGDHDRPLRVNCDAGESLGKALRQAQPGSAIRVRGTCTERVTITTDRLTLDGRGTAVLDGGGAGSLGIADVVGVITVDGARGVTITGFTVQNGQDGIVGHRGAVFAVRNTLVQDNAAEGIVAQHNTTVEITDCTARRNGVAGISLWHSSSAIFRGTIRSENNAFGVHLAASVGDFIGVTLEANNNSIAGISAGDSSHLVLGGRYGGAPSQITTNGNGEFGINLLGDVTLASRGGTSTITAMHNPVGLRVIGNAAVVNHPNFLPGDIGGVFRFEHNTTGVQLDVQAGFFSIGGLTVQNNTTGLLADGANTVTVVSIPPNPSTITGNVTDVDLRFGTRATFNVPIGTITCDDTVLIRGTTVCP